MREQCARGAYQRDCHWRVEEIRVLEDIAVTVQLKDLETRAGSGEEGK